MNHDWRTAAACSASDVAFFPPTSSVGVVPSWDPRPAKAVCADCPVARECLATALANDERIGVWGGIDLARGVLGLKAVPHWCGTCEALFDGPYGVRYCDDACRRASRVRHNREWRARRQEAS